MPRPRVATLAAAGLVALLVAAEVALAVRFRSLLGDAFAEALLSVVGFAAVAGVCVAAALVVSHHAPGNWVGPLLALLGVEAVLFGAASVPPPSPPPPAALDAFLEGSWMWFYVPVGVLLAVFPHGRPVNRSGRVVVVGLPACALLFQVLAALGDGGPASAAATALLPVFLGLLLASAVSIVKRYGAGGRTLRAQVRWLALVGWALPLTLLLGWLSYFVTGGSDVVVTVGFAVLYAALPLATAVAVARHRLYDVDDALIATLAYAVMAAVLLLAFLSVSTLSGLLVGRSSVVAAVLVTAVVAFALGSVRGRVESAVARAVFPARERALRGLARLAADVRGGRAEPEAVVEVLRTTLRDPGLVVTFPNTGADDGTGTPARLGGEVVAHVRAGPTATREPPRDVADAASLLLAMVRLRADLSTALREVERSRERLLVAGYEERRRLERDLHDGAQQRLVSLGVRLRVLQRSLGPDGAVVADELDAAVAQVSTTVAELRGLAHGIRPSSLDDGLPAALAHLSQTSPVPVHLEVARDVDGSTGPGLPDAVATTAYFVIAEAVTNAVRYADADGIVVRLQRDGADVVLRVSDDGRGGARPRPGAGLAGLEDRVGAVGGRMALDSPPGAGTVLEARLPCGS
jgi:signal transduction histidine kinase